MIKPHIPLSQDPCLNVTQSMKTLKIKQTWIEFELTQNGVLEIEFDKNCRRIKELSYGKHILRQSYRCGQLYQTNSYWNFENIFCV